ncbi:MAG TPA: spore germination protein GerW family protein [Methanothrix sp.]|nr:spore germination protein GerW family protein [Methanothrix sp.]
MEGIAEILKTITTEMQKSLSARTVVGDPVSLDGKTVIPLVSVGMGFGAGTGMGKGQETVGGGGGGGLGMKPVAVIIADEQGVRVERLRETKQSLVGQLAEALPKIAEGMPKKTERQVEIEGQRE